MRNPFGRKRESGSTAPLVHKSSRQHLDSNHMYFSDNDVGSTLQYTWAIDPETAFEEKAKSDRIRVGKLVKKLNCTASHKEHDRHHNRHHDRPHTRLKNRRGKRPKERDLPRKERDSPPRSVDSLSYDTPMNKGTSWGCVIPSAKETKTRDVFITVKNGEKPQGKGQMVSTARGNRRNERPILQPGKSARRSPERARGSPRSAPPQQPPLHHGSPPRRSPSPNKQESRLTARKERWKKGLQKGYADDADVPSRIGGDDTYYQDTRTNDSMTSYDTDFTTEGSSDDSDNYNRRPPPRNRSRKASQPRPAPRPSKSKNNDDDLWSGMAEDIGIIAGLLLSDGTACVGSVAEITKETVVDSCK